VQEHGPERIQYYYASTRLAALQMYEAYFRRRMAIDSAISKEGYERESKSILDDILDLFLAQQKTSDSERFMLERVLLKN
jgi:hypothetical protein